MLKKYQQQTLAIELLKRHARVKIVHQVTGIPIKPLRQTYRQLHGRSPSPGSIKFSTHGLTGSRRKYKDVTLFAICYRAASGNLTNTTIQTLITAFDAYKHSYPSGQIDISAGWVITQDLITKKIELTCCPNCKVWNLLNARENHPEDCCICKTTLSK